MLQHTAYTTRQSKHETFNSFNTKVPLLTGQKDGNAMRELSDVWTYNAH